MFWVNVKLKVWANLNLHWLLGSSEFTGTLGKAQLLVIVEPELSASMGSWFSLSFLGQNRLNWCGNLITSAKLHHPCNETLPLKWHLIGFSICLRFKRKACPGHLKQSMDHVGIVLEFCLPYPAPTLHSYLYYNVELSSFNNICLYIYLFKQVTLCEGLK